MRYGLSGSNWFESKPAFTVMVGPPDQEEPQLVAKLREIATRADHSYWSFRSARHCSGDQ